MKKKMDSTKNAFSRIIILVLLGLTTVFVTVAIAIAVDTDQDGIDDEYEVFFGRDLANDGNDDSDTLLNFQEAGKWTDPLEGDTDTDGLEDHEDDDPLSRAVILWGNPSFTFDDRYSYTGPDWWRGAWKNGGEWCSNGWHSITGEEDNSLCIDLDRTIISQNLRMALEFDTYPCTSVHIDLLGNDSAGIVLDVFGDIAGNKEMPLIVDLPLTNYPAASLVRIRLGKGEMTVYSTILYIDEDGDGLDAAQERQFGTSDRIANDFTEDEEGEVVIAIDNLLNDKFRKRESVLSGANLTARKATEKGRTNGYVNVRVVRGSIVYVDKQNGRDEYVGRNAKVVLTASKGPKQTVKAGLRELKEGETLVIRRGDYRADLNVAGRNVRVLIDGNVSLQGEAFPEKITQRPMMSSNGVTTKSNSVFSIKQEIER